jgi:hypothetical protein
MDWDLVIWFAVLALTPFVWLIVLGSQARVKSVDESGFSLFNRISGTHYLRWDQLRGAARRFETFSISAGRPRIELSFRPQHRFLALRSGFAVRIEATPEFRQFELALPRYVPVITVRNLLDLFRRT